MGWNNKYMHIFKSTAINNEEKSSYKLWSLKRPNIRHLKIFGTKVYVHLPKKIESKSRERNLYEIQKGTRCFNQSNEIEKHKDMSFKREYLMCDGNIGK